MNFFVLFVTPFMSLVGGLYVHASSSWSKHENTTLRSCQGQTPFCPPPSPNGQLDFTLFALGTGSRKTRTSQKSVVVKWNGDTNNWLSVHIRLTAGNARNAYTWKKMLELFYGTRPTSEMSIERDSPTSLVPYSPLHSQMASNRAARKRAARKPLREATNFPS